MDLYQKNICEWWNLCAIGHHSATRLWKHNGSSWTLAMDMCNHGSCPGSMSWVCRSNGAYGKWTQFHMQTCRTSYNAFSNDGHNCHDDSRVHMANFMEGRCNIGYQQWCSNGDHFSDISSGPGDQSGYPNCSGTDYNKGYAYSGASGPCPSAYQCASGSDRLCAGQALSAGQSRTSTDNRFTFVYQTDGNLVLYQTSNRNALWARNAWGQTTAAASMQTDGNFLVYNAAWSPKWASSTFGSGLFLIVQNDGNVVIYDPYWQPRWSTGTGGR